MIITLNGEKRNLESAVSVSELLFLNNVEKPEMVSVQLNGNFVEKNNYKDLVVKENDEIDFLYFMGGGERGFTTKAIHSGMLKKDVHGALRMPVYDSVAFEFDNSNDLKLAFEGKKPCHSYSRITNPTVEDFEQRIKLLSDAFGVVAVSSGMAAISNIIMAIAEAGTNIVTTKFIFGNTYSLFEKTLKPWGLEVRYADMTDFSNIEEKFDSKTRAVFLETITNPQLQVADIQKIAELSAKHDIPLIIDGTLTTPYIFKSKDYGVAVEIISSTKYISGGAATVGGLIIDNGIFDWKKSPRMNEASKKYGPYALISHLKREVYRNLGSCLSAHNAFLQTLGLETLALRVNKSCENALHIANFLQESDKVKSVNYPGLTSSQYNEISKRQFRNRAGGLLTFELSGQAECFKFMDALGFIRRATNLNDNKTLVIHPSSTIFCEYTPEEKAAMGVSDSMIRMAIGIEDIEDLFDDIRKGLSSL